MRLILPAIVLPFASASTELYGFISKKTASLGVELEGWLELFDPGTIDTVNQRATPINIFQLHSSSLIANPFFQGSVHFYDRPFPLAAMSEDFDQETYCNEAWLGSPVLSMTSNDDMSPWINRGTTGPMLRWTTARLEFQDGTTLGCTTMIGDTVVLENEMGFARKVNEDNNRNGVVFYDRAQDPHDILLTNVETSTVGGTVPANNGLEYCFSTCDDNSNGASDCLFHEYTHVWENSNSWQRIVVDSRSDEVMSVYIGNECVDLSSNVPFAATTKKIENTFDNSLNGETGNFLKVSFEQMTPFHETLMKIDYTAATSLGGFHVHQTYMFNNEECSATGGHFNPFNVVNDGSDTAHDTFEIGDLSGKHGAMDVIASATTPFNSGERLTTQNIERFDYNLPLWGKNSIAGRSIVFHDVFGDRLYCTNIGMMAYERDIYPTIRELRVNLKEHAGDSDSSKFADNSHIYFLQNADDYTSPVVVLSNLGYADAAKSDTGATWSLHDTSVSTAYGASDCAGVGSQILASVVGDNAVTIGGSGSMKRMQHTEVHMNSWDFAGKSIVITEDGQSDAYACGTLKNMPKYLKAFFSSGLAAADAVSGWVWMDRDFDLNNMGWSYNNSWTCDWCDSNIGSSSAQGFVGWLDMSTHNTVSGQIFHKPYARAMFAHENAVPGDLGDQCNDGTMTNMEELLSNFQHLNEIAYTTLKIQNSNGGIACATLIPDNADLSYASGFGANGYAQFFKDANNDIAIANVEASSFVSGDNTCANSPSQFSADLSIITGGYTYSDANSWAIYRNFKESGSVVVDECVDFGGLPSYAKTEYADFDNDGTTDSKIFMWQPTPFHPTRLRRVFRDALFAEYGIWADSKMPMDTCVFLDQSATLFDPSSKSASGASLGVSGHDEFPIGELSAKFPDAITGEFITYDGNLPLWGAFSVVGRTMFYKNFLGGLVGCSKIGFAVDNEYEWRDLPSYHEAWVHFSGNLRGSVVFQQLKTDDPNYPVGVTGMTPTLVNFVDLRLNTIGWRDEVLGGAGGSYDFEFRVLDRVEAGELQYESCSDSGSLTPDDAVSGNSQGTTWTMAVDARPAYSAACKWGDLHCKRAPSGMVFTLDATNYARMTTIDPSLPMISGSNSKQAGLVGLTLLAHSSGNNVACSAINQNNAMDALLEVGSVSSLGEKTAAVINEVFDLIEEHFDHDEVTLEGVTRRRRQALDIAQEVDGYGCWCSRPVSGTSFGGQPLDELDEICRTWAQCMKCQPEECKETEDKDYEVVYTMEVNCTCITGSRDLSDFMSYECVDQDECTRNRCECDMAYALRLYSYLYDIGHVIPTEFMNVDESLCIPGFGKGHNACCGVAPLWFSYHTNAGRCDSITGQLLELANGCTDESFCPAD